MPVAPLTGETKAAKPLPKLPRFIAKIIRTLWHEEIEPGLDREFEKGVMFIDNSVNKVVMLLKSKYDVIKDKVVDYLA